MNERAGAEHPENETFQALLALAHRLEWSGVLDDGSACCPVCRLPQANGAHAPGCDLANAIAGAVTEDRWPWCRCDECECPERVNPGLVSAICLDCSHDVHRPERSRRDV